MPASFEESRRTTKTTGKGSTNRIREGKRTNHISLCVLQWFAYIELTLIYAFKIR